MRCAFVVSFLGYFSITKARESALFDWALTPVPKQKIQNVERNKILKYFIKSVYFFRGRVKNR